jgi:hypothetical protein
VNTPAQRYPDDFEVAVSIMFCYVQVAMGGGLRLFPPALVRELPMRRPWDRPASGNVGDNNASSQTRFEEAMFQLSAENRSGAV